jgi:hypothetical protein
MEASVWDPERVAMRKVDAVRPHRLDAGLEARLEAGFDEFVEVAVQHFLGVAALDAGAQVLDAALVQHVVADLAAPADVGLGRFQRVLLGVALLDFELVELGRSIFIACRGSGMLRARSGRPPPCWSGHG